MSAPPNSIPPPPPPPARPAAPGQTVHLQPAFLRAWSGIWLFTWKSLLTWRRLRWTLGPVARPAVPGLEDGGFPAIMVCHARTPCRWADSTNDMRRVSWQMSGGVVRGGLLFLLARSRTSQLQQIFTEEYARTQKDYRAIPSPETSVDQQRALVQSCHQRILAACQGRAG